MHDSVAPGEGPEPSRQRDGRSEQETFGAALCRWRNRRGLSLRALGPLVNYSAGQLCKIEKGKRTPAPGFAEVCDRVLEAGGALAAFASSGSRRRRSRLAAGQSVKGSVLVLAFLAEAGRQVLVMLPGVVVVDPATGTGTP
ncbi:hypothetical protein GCM10012275_53950 [Longimycelium tulufanense]|uniref:HTH cro/C1-type domain-containing protein n=1 Tax=Longimycelium tulufanense TaxID=907463 RepID=A0A8J3CJF8_9PSEU|nr:helix-turn-helix transcriptional regulator [Longimycelium tulufanense]GGM76396.1 hypothetical protein GCM10012275_53950 [Longimycelium tulufanense]